MITVSFNSESENLDFDKTAETITKYIKSDLNRDVTIIKEENNIEVVSGNYPNNLEGSSIDISFKFKRNISDLDFQNLDKLDKVLFQIKKCLASLAEIEKDSYIPIQFRRAND